MKKIVIIGGGIAGLMCAHVLKKSRNASVVLLEPNEIGGNYNIPGLKTIRQTKQIEELFKELNILYSNYIIDGAVFTGKKLLQFPLKNKVVGKSVIDKIKTDFYIKTRKLQPPKKFYRHFDDQCAIGIKKSVKCDYDELIKKLSNGIAIKKESCVSIGDNVVITNRGRILRYDHLVSTIPLWSLKKICDWDIPDSKAMNLTVSIVDVNRDKYSLHDFIYTPYTPKNCIHKMSITGCDYAVESNGVFKEKNLHKDLDYLFPDGWKIKKMYHNLSGYMFQLDKKPILPDNVALVGKFSQWDGSVAADSILNTALSLYDQWSL